MGDAVDWGRGRGDWGPGGRRALGEGEPDGHVVTLGEVGEEYVAGGDVALEVFERVRAVELAVTRDLIGHAGLLGVGLEHIGIGCLGPMKTRRAILHNAFDRWWSRRPVKECGRACTMPISQNRDMGHPVEVWA